MLIMMNLYYKLHRNIYTKVNKKITNNNLICVNNHEKTANKIMTLDKITWQIVNNKILILESHIKEEMREYV